MALNPNVFVDGVMNGFSLHIEPPSYLTKTATFKYEGDVTILGLQFQVDVTNGF